MHVSLPRRHASTDGPGGLLYACLTHVPLAVAFPAFVQPLYLGASQRDEGLNLRDLAPEWEPHHPTLGSTAGAFALRRLLLTRYPHATRVGICQYRRFVSRRRIRRGPASRDLFVNVVSKTSLTPQALARGIDPGEADLLVGTPIVFANTLSQYEKYHHVEDLLRFTAEAVAVGALDSHEVSSFLGETGFVPGGIELGVFPAAFWIRSIEHIEDTLRSCVRNLASHREGYQTRAWAFCAERLGSYLLLKEFRQSEAGGVLPERYIGQINVIDMK